MILKEPIDMHTIRLIIPALTFMLSSTHAYAQEHILFKGVPVDGTNALFSEQLASRGFTTTGTHLAGKFAGYDVTVHTMVTETSGTVYAATASLRAAPWKEAKANYVCFKANLALKYGDPSSSCEKFSGAYHEGDGFEVKALAEDYCRYVSEWNVENGIIRLEIRHAAKGASVRITYEDTVNLRLNTKEKTDIFLQDL